MRGKSLALLIVSLGCGLVASLGITQVLAKRGDSTPTDTTPVYVATTDIGIGSVATGDSVRVEQWPKDKVPAGAVLRMEDLDGRRARQKIYAGEPIIEAKLLIRGQVPTDSTVPKGLRVIAIPVSYEAIQGGLVLPGARCDLQVVIKQDPGNGVAETFCKTILQDIRVFAVNDVTSTDTLDPKNPDVKSLPAGRTVSLLVTPSQAQTVTLASQMGTIRLALRNGEDNEQAKTSSTGFRDMVGSSGGGDRAKENPLAEGEKRFLEWADAVRSALKKAKAAPAKAAAQEDVERFKMRVLVGPGVKTRAEVNDVLLINNAGVQGLPGEGGAWTAMNLGSGANSSPMPEPHSPEPEPAATPVKPAAEKPVPPATPGSPRSPAGG